MNRRAALTHTYIDYVCRVGLLTEPSSLRRMLRSAYRNDAEAVSTALAGFRCSESLDRRLSTGVAISLLKLSPTRAWAAFSCASYTKE